MPKQKKDSISNFFALGFVAVLVVMLAFNGAGWYTERFVQVRDSIEERFAAYPDMRIEWALKHYVFGYYTRLTNRAVSNGVVILRDGRMVHARQSDPPFLYERADEIVKLKNYLEDRDTPFLFIRVPSGMRDNSELLHGLSESVTVLEDTERFISRLKSKDVDVFDLREEMMREGVDFSAMFYRGDHHWNAYGAMYGYGKIGELLNNEYGFGLDAKTWEINEYDAITFRNAFIGGLSMRLDNSAEDITALIPKFETDIRATIEDPLDGGEHGRRSVRGSFADVFVPKSKESNVQEFIYQDLNAMHSRYSRYTNRLASNDKRILLLADSFGLDFATYLSTAVERVDSMFLNDMTVTPELLYPTLAEEEYDMVLFMLYDGSILADVFEFNQGRLTLGNPVD